MSGRVVVALIVVALVVVAITVGAACSRDADMGPDEAIEVLVLDGLDRAEAECLVNGVRDDLELAEVTGVDGDLDSAELSVLLEASLRCQPVAVPGGSEIVGGSLDELSDLDEIELIEGLDAEGLVVDLLRGGLDPDVAVCVVVMLITAPDPLVAVGDETRKLDAITACEGG